MKTLLILAAAFAVSSAAAQSLEQRVADHIVALQNDDFQAIDRAVAGKRLVILGEAGHWDGTTFEIRTRLTQHLLKNGFDAIGFEAADFLGAEMFPAGEDIRKSDLAYMHRKTVECQPIMEAINRGEVPFFGIDLGYTLTIPLFEKLLDNINYSFDHDRFARVCDTMITAEYDFPDYVPLSAEDDVWLVTVLREVENLCRRPGHDLLRQAIFNMKTMYAMSKVPRNKMLSLDADTEYMYQITNLRDAAMASNILWWLDHNPGKRAVVWCANFHAARNISQALYPERPGFSTRMRVMGERLGDRLGEDLYSLAFTSGGKEKSFEGVLAARGVEQGFVDFAPLRFTELGDQMFTAGLIRYKSAYWMNMYDGIFYHREQHRPVEISAM